MGHHPKKRKYEKLSSKEKLKLNQKEAKKFRTEKKARLIVRNLPFKTTEKDLLEHYKKFGDVKEVKLLRRPDGHLVGCGFVQFNEVQKAAKARHHTNGKPFLDRNIECDWALSKDKYVQKFKKVTDTNKEDVPIKDETIDVDEIKTEENGENSRDDAVIIKSEDEDEEGDSSEKNKINDVDEDKLHIEKAENDDDNEDDDFKDSENGDSVDEEEDVDDEVDVKPAEKKPRFISNDVAEGKTVFVKNIPFTATNEDLKQVMLQFGPVYYALICVDKYTEHSKGTAFVKFVNLEGAEKCLQAGTELQLMGNILDCHKALNRNEINNSKDKKEGKGDNRNLYLVKEGVIMAGSKAADGVSASDMAKRLQIEQYKTQMLRNLNMFISKNRLVVHNLPSSWDDSKFKQLMLKHAGPKAFIKEARVMRDMKKLDSNGVGASKEFGFVTFATHEQALAALRSLNNNPHIFSANKRPIISFSIENKVMLKAKEKRLLNSRKRNPKSKDYDPSLGKADEAKNVKGQETNKAENQKKRKHEPANNKKQLQKQKKVTENDGGGEEPEFAGVAAKPGVCKMRSRYNLKTQAQLHSQHLKERKKRQKLSKKTLNQKKTEFIRQPSQKINKKPHEDDNFSKLVNSYKSKLLAAPASKKSKWYEES